MGVGVGVGVEPGVFVLLPGGVVPPAPGWPVPVVPLAPVPVVPPLPEEPKAPASRAPPKSKPALVLDNAPFALLLLRQGRLNWTQFPVTRGRFEDDDDEMPPAALLTAPPSWMTPIPIAPRPMTAATDPQGPDGPLT